MFPVSEYLCNQVRMDNFDFDSTNCIYLVMSTTGLNEFGDVVEIGHDFLDIWELFLEVHSEPNGVINLRH